MGVSRALDETQWRGRYSRLRRGLVTAVLSSRGGPWRMWTMMGRVSVTSGSTLVSSLTCPSTTATVPMVSNPRCHPHRATPTGFCSLHPALLHPMGGGLDRDSPWAPWGRDSSQTSRAPLLVRKPSLHHAPGPFHAPPRALLTPPPISHPSLVSSVSLHWVLPCPQM